MTSGGDILQMKCVKISVTQLLSHYPVLIIFVAFGQQLFPGSFITQLLLQHSGTNRADKLDTKTCNFWREKNTLDIGITMLQKQQMLPGKITKL